MFNYPVYFNISSYACLVVGAGEVARRKALSLLKAEAGQVTMVAPSLPALPPLLAEEEKLLQAFPQFKRCERKFSPEDLEGCFFVFAATNDLELNARIAILCKKKGCICNVASNPLQGDFIVPASFEAKDIRVAVSSNGKSPALARVIRDDFKKHLGNRYEQKLDFLDKLRQPILNLKLTELENKMIFKALAQADLDFLFNDKKECIKDIQRELPTKLPIGLSDELRENVLKIILTFFK